MGLYNNTNLQFYVTIRSSSSSSVSSSSSSSSDSLSLISSSSSSLSSSSKSSSSSSSKSSSSQSISSSSKSSSSTSVSSSSSSSSESANDAAFDPDFTSPNITLSDGDRRATKSISNSTYEITRSKRGRSSGKYYFELYIYQIDTSQRIGFASISVPISGAGAIYPINGAFVYYGSNRIYYGPNSGDYVFYSTNPSNGSIYRYAVDLDSGKTWIALDNNAWLGGGDPETGTSPTVNFSLGDVLFPMVSFYNSSDISYRGLIGNITYSIPSGFNLW